MKSFRFKPRSKLVVAAFGILMFIGGVMLLERISSAPNSVEVSIVGYKAVDERRVATIQIFNPTSRMLAVMVDRVANGPFAITDYEQRVEGVKTNWSYASGTAASPAFISPNTSTNVNVVVPTNGPSKVWISVGHVMSSPGTAPRDRLVLLLVNRKLIEPTKKVLLPELDWDERKGEGPNR